MSEEEEEQLANGLNMLHDAGSVHASDLQKLMTFFEVAEREQVVELSGSYFTAAVAIIMLLLLSYPTSSSSYSHHLLLY